MSGEFIKYFCNGSESCINTCQCEMYKAVPYECPIGLYAVSWKVCDSPQKSIEGVPVQTGNISVMQFPGVNEVETVILNEHPDSPISHRPGIARIVRETYEYLAGKLA